MTHPLTLPALAILSVVGAGVGIQLGRSAIAEINPVHFAEEAPSLFHADLVPYRRSTTDGPQQLAANAPLPSSPTIACFGCGIMAPEYHPSEPTYLAPAESPRARRGRRDSAEQPLEETSVQLPPDIARYAHYRVSGDESELAYAEPPAQPAEGDPQ